MKLHEYQKYCIEFIIKNKECGLFLEMGLGKSVIALTAIERLPVKKVLIIAPLRVAKNTWSDECKKWEHLKHLNIVKVLGTKEQRIKVLEKESKIYIINRENVSWLVDYKFDFDMVVIDELSSFKSCRSERFKSLKRVRHQVKRIVGLTGTPASNNLEDLWAQVYLLDGGKRFGKFIGSFRNEYFVPDKRSQFVVFSYKPKADAEERIYKKISDICLSMKSCDYLKMPERVDNYVEVKLSAKEMKLYKEMEKEMILKLVDGDILALNAAVLAGKLVQLANGAAYDENKDVKLIHNRKIDALEDIIEAANGKPVLVFYGYRHDRDRIRQRFKVRELISTKDMDDWNSGKIDIAITHPASTGHGLNLQFGGSTIVWLSLTWSLELYEQANARLLRQGQKETVVIHHIVAKDTIDENVIRALKNKSSVQEMLMEAINVRKEYC